MRIICFSLAVSLAAPLAAQEQQMDDVQIDVVPVAEGVHMLTGRGGNIGVSAGPDGEFGNLRGCQVRFEDQVELHNCLLPGLVRPTWS